MELGGYVSYTVSGFKCHTFGPKNITDTINRLSSELDIPQSISLRPGRRGFRRDLLRGPTSSVIVYTAFVGLSEPTVTRLGSFLAVGIAFQNDADCIGRDVGYALSQLLTNLAGKVSNGKRFSQNLSVDIINAFLGENSKVLEEMHDFSMSTSRSFVPRAEQSAVYLSDEKGGLSTSFNKVCGYVSPSTNFFLFEMLASAELQNAKYDFKTVHWPIRAAQIDNKTSSRPSVDAHDYFSTASSEQESLRNLELLIENMVHLTDTKITNLEKSLSEWRFVTIAGICVLTVLLSVNFGIFNSWHSSTSEEVAALTEQIKKLQSATPTLSSLSSSDSQPSPPSADTAPVSEPLRKQLAMKMNANEIREKLCLPLKNDKKKFDTEFSQLNTKKNITETFDRNSIVLLPAGCRQRC